MEESISTPVPGKPVEDAGEGTGAAQESAQLDQGVGKMQNAEPAGRLLYQDARVTPVIKSESRKLYEDAVENAQYVMAYASSKCMKDVDKVTVEKLIRARNLLKAEQDISPAEEAEFWIAYQDLWKVVRPLTAECIRATEGPKARKTINWHIGFTIFVLLVLLVLQIYWVIGNQLTTKLADLLQQEATLSSDISTNQDEYNAIELRFKLDEMTAESYPGYFTYLASPEFERDTAANRATRLRLDAELASLKSQLERNGAILQVWSNPWFRLIQPSLQKQTNEIDTDIQNNTNQIEDISKLLSTNLKGQTKSQIALAEIERVEAELNGLDQNSTENTVRISNLQDQLNTAYADYYYYSDLEQQLEDLKAENSSLNVQEKSRQAQLAALFVLIILQSYLLPLLYGLLGASTSSLRSLSQEIEDVKFSDKRRIQHVLRIALGALSGIMIGWFSFLYEGTTLLRSVPPLALAFLVGYNIELFFSLMDRAIDAVKRLGKSSPETDNSTPVAANVAGSTTEKDKNTETPAASIPVTP